MTPKVLSTIILSVVAAVIFAVMIVGAQIYMPDQKQKKHKWTIDKDTIPILGLDGPLMSEPSLGRREVSQSDREFNTHTHGVAGALSIVAMPDPNPEKLSGEYKEPKLYLYIDFEGGEWDALFYKVFNCPAAVDEPPRADESEEVWEERFSRKFRQAIPDYPMLGRIWDMFIYVSYSREEVTQLRDESSRVIANTSNKKTISGLTKVISACDEALKHNYGLLFVPD